jgi:hypothetical protein
MKGVLQTKLELLKHEQGVDLKAAWFRRAAFFYSI